MARSRRPLLRRIWYGATAAVLVAAVVIGAIAGASLEVAIAIPACLAATVAASRLPSAVAMVMLGLTGIVGTVLVLTEVSPRYLIDIFLAGIVLATLWRLSTERGHARPRLPLSVIVVVGYLIVSVGQALVSPSISIAQSAFRSTAWQTAIIPAIALAGWSLATRRRILRSYLVLICLVAAYAVMRLVIGAAEEELDVALALAPANVLPSGDIGLFGSMLSRHQLAVWCGIALPFATAVALVRDSGRRSIPLAAAALSAIALMGTQTRGGFAGGIAGLAVVILLYAAARAFPGPRLRGALLPLGTVLGALAVGFIATSLATSAPTEEVSQRYTTLATPAEDTAFAARLTTWGSVIDDTVRRPLGHGFGTAGLSIDNAYLRVGYEQGALVMLLFAAMVVAIAVSLARSAVVSEDRTAAAISMACCGGFVASTVSLFVIDAIEPALVGWTLAGLGIAELASRRRPG